MIKINMFSTLVIFTILFGCGLARNILTETTCQTHQQNTGGAHAPLRWNITCDEQGYYRPIQCTIQATPVWCTCYDKEGPITRPSTKTKTCECHLKKAEAMKANQSPCEIPTCATDGSFEKKQCCPRDNKCRCVDPRTGQTTVQPTADRNLQCP